MRQAEAACADDEYPVCLAIFADGVNVKKNLEAHPVFCTLMNYDDKPRMTQRCMRLLGIIPGIGTASNYTKDEIRMRNMAIIHHSFTYALANFNELHSVAKMRVCPDGKRRKTRLFLCMMPGDMKEHWALTCMTHKNCHICKVPKNKQADTDAEYEMWTPHEEERRYDGESCYGF